MLTHNSSHKVHIDIPEIMDMVRLASQADGKIAQVVKSGWESCR